MNKMYLSLAFAIGLLTSLSARADLRTELAQKRTYQRVSGSAFFQREHRAEMRAVAFNLLGKSVISVQTGGRGICWSDENTGQMEEIYLAKLKNGQICSILTCNGTPTVDHCER